MSKDICKVNKRRYKKAASPALIFITYDGDIIKSIPCSKDNEGKWLKKLNKDISSPERFLFNLPVVSKKCGNYNYYLFEKSDGDLDELLINTKLTIPIKKNLLLQSLVAIYTMNEKMNFYHNDLYARKKIRNVMYLKIDQDLNVGMDVVAKKYLVKVIDFEWMSEGKCKLRSKEYNFMKQGCSELTIFTYIYLLTLHPDLDKKKLKRDILERWNGDPVEYINRIKKDFTQLYKKFS